MTAYESLRPANILLVEDNENDVVLTIEALKESKLHIDLHAVSDGVSAMAFLHREKPYADKPRPDLILLDLKLPLMNGLEILQEIKADISLVDIPVVVFTTSENEADILAAYQLHANCYIQKPVDFAKFTEIINCIEGFWLQLVKLPRPGSSNHEETTTISPDR